MTTVFPHQQARARRWIRQYLLLLATAGAVSWAAGGAIDAPWLAAGHLALAALGCVFAHRDLRGPWTKTRFDALMSGLSTGFSAFLPISIAGSTAWSWALVTICWTASFVVLIHVDLIARRSARGQDSPTPVRPAESD